MTARLPTYVRIRPHPTAPGTWSVSAKQRGSEHAVRTIEISPPRCRTDHWRKLARQALDALTADGWSTNAVWKVHDHWGDGLVLERKEPTP